MIKFPTHSPITESKMFNCAIITLERESALTHPPPHTLTHLPSRAHANATTLADAHAHVNATSPHPRYCAAGSTSVICKMTILQRQSSLMDDLVRSNPPSTSRLAEGPL
ncbi:hypothetical protein O181_065549 [Austropuccinia psidii MF-1]|uniref:Uncharacterized protein n=1 Tax=Austropuccinia psidii MF-1 TaxID=1389203 RepID=A0A9Q3I4N2_9BASI|nr:hypothetical protein [Austropuccinia psidii MF-1]